MLFRGLDIEKFKNWLLTNGAEIVPCTNEFEALRFKGLNTGVLYHSGKTSGTYTDYTIECYLKGKSWRMGKPKGVERGVSYRNEKIQLLKRDGDKCFYCGKELLDDITLEHIISLVSGGKNTLGNMVLAHFECNQEAGNLSVYQKMELAIKKRIENDPKKLISGHNWLQ